MYGTWGGGPGPMLAVERQLWLAWMEVRAEENEAARAGAGGGGGGANTSAMG